MERKRDPSPTFFDAPEKGPEILRVLDKLYDVFGKYAEEDAKLRLQEERQGQKGSLVSANIESSKSCSDIVRKLVIRVERDAKLDDMASKLTNKRNDEMETITGMNHLDHVIVEAEQCQVEHVKPTKSSSSSSSSSTNTVPIVISSLVCAVCGAKFQRGDSYRRHVKQQHGPGFKCSIVGCTRVFKRESQKRKHEICCKIRLNLLT